MKIRMNGNRGAEPKARGRDKPNIGFIVCSQIFENLYFIYKLVETQANREPARHSTSDAPGPLFVV